MNDNENDKNIGNEKNSNDDLNNTDEFNNLDEFDDNYALHNIARANRINKLEQHRTIKESYSMSNYATSIARIILNIYVPCLVTLGALLSTIFVSLFSLYESGTIQKSGQTIISSFPDISSENIIQLTPIVVFSLITILLCLYSTNLLRRKQISFFTLWNQSKYILAFACGGCFLGGLIGSNLFAILGAIFGGAYGVFYQGSLRTVGVVIDNNKNLNKIWIQGEHSLAFASGGAFLGGILGQAPGAIIGCVVGIFFSFVQ